MSTPERVVPVSEFKGGPRPGVAGFGVSYRVVKMRTDGFGKPKHEVTFDDLWKMEDNVWVPRDPGRVVEDVMISNKFLKRGLDHLISTCLRNKGTVTEAERHLSDIDAGTRGRNPLRALILVSDDNPLVHPGDSRVEWNESDTTANAKIASSVGGAFTPAGYGIRGCYLNASTGTLKVVQSRYPDTTYYTQLEYTVFASANVSPVETGADGIDNFPIKSIGIAYGLQAGYNDADSQWASRAVVGLFPTIQGWKWPERVGKPSSGNKGTDRVYAHENYIYDDAGSGQVTALHKYTGTETIVSVAQQGYLASYEAADGSLPNDVSVSITPGASDQFYSATRQIKLTNGAFTEQHARDRCMLDVDTTTLGGANTGKFTIKRIIGAAPSDTVEVFETVVNEGPGNVNSADLVSVHTGDKVFDGRVENEGKVYGATDDGDPNAEVIMGQNWRSEDVPSGHYVARIWTTARQIAGIRIICGKGTPREYAPDRWKVQYLNATHWAGGDVRPDDPNDWTDVPGQDYTGSGGLAATVYNAGQWGVEYHFAALTPSTQGIKIRDLQNEAQDGYVEIQQILAYEEADDHVIAAPNNVIKIAVDGVPNFKTITVPAVAATKNMQDIVDALNQVFLGEELEALRSEFGFLLIRSTVEGDNSYIELDTNGNGSTINASLGLDPTSGVPEKSGESQPITKQYDEALTLIVVASYEVDLPWAT